jgi:hypothetical protein
MATALALHHGWMRRCGCRVGFYRADKVGKRKEKKRKQNKTNKRIEKKKEKRKKKKEKKGIVDISSF